MLGESQAIARKKFTELPRPQMGLATFQMSFGRQLYYEADLTDDLGASVDRALGILSSGTIEKAELSTGTLQESWIGLAGSAESAVLIWCSTLGQESLGLLSVSD